MPGDLNSGSKPGRHLDPGDRQAKGEPWKNNRALELAADGSFHDRENRYNLLSRLWATDVQPILSIKRYRTPGVLARHSMIRGGRGAGTTPRSSYDRQARFLRLVTNTKYFGDSPSGWELPS
jgi:hypothetical protein